MARSIFDFESEDRVESPDKLNEYIRVAGPGVWAVAAALVIVFIALILWTFTGRIVDHASFMGYVDETADNGITIFIDASKYSGSSLVGSEAKYLLKNGIKGEATVVSSSETPRSKDDLKKLLGNDFLTSNLVTSDYSYILTLKPKEDLSQYSEELADVLLITSEIRPISIISDNGGSGK